VHLRLIGDDDQIKTVLGTASRKLEADTRRRTRDQSQLTSFRSHGDLLRRENQATVHCE
jgi:hypothetical protein